MAEDLDERRVIPPHPDILTVRDAEILRLLHKVVDIGAYRKSFTATDVAHVVNRWLVPREDGEPAKVTRLQPVVELPDAPELPDAQIVELTAGQTAIVTELCRGEGKRTNIAIAFATDSTEQIVQAQLHRVYKAIGNHNRAEVVALIRSGQVRVQLKPSRKKAS